MENEEEFFQDLDVEMMKKMSENFDFKQFYETSPHIALITITQYDVIIIYSNTTNKDFERHSYLLNKACNELISSDRMNYSVMTYRCSSVDSSKSLLFYMVDIKDGRIITKEMIEAMELIHKIVSIIDENNQIVKGNINEIKKFNNITESENTDSLKEAEIIGVPINEFIDKIKKQIYDLQPTFEIYRNPNIIIDGR